MIKLLGMQAESTRHLRILLCIHVQVRGFMIFPPKVSLFPSHLQVL